MKQRIIYNNYDLGERYDEARNFLLEEHDEEELTEEVIWNEIYFQSEVDLDNEHYMLKRFFNHSGYWMLRGECGRWDGSYGAGYVFTDFDDMFYKATESCDYIKIWDENGHFYLQCSHHDGTNFYEIKRITDRAYDIIDNWAHNWNDDRSEEQMHDIVWNSNFYSSLPHYAHKVYGCKKRETA